MISEPLFDTWIAEPLALVLGEPLLAVNYWVLECDCPTFEADAPNASGIAKIDLDFQTTTLEVTWGWEKRLRNGGTAYHLQVSPLNCRSKEAVNGQVWNASGLCRITGTQAQTWAEAIGNPLTHIEVYGLGDSPQAIRFSFIKSDIVVATGYGGEDLMIGDGDDLLLFQDSEWQDRSGREAWPTLWTATAQSNISANRAMEYATTSRS